LNNVRLTDEKSLLEQVTVEQFRQNLALLKAEEIEIPKKWMLELLNTIEALQQENEQLRAQVARMREALIECVNALELCTHDELCKIVISPYDMIQDAKEALAEIEKQIGGKEDANRI